MKILKDIHEVIMSISESKLQPKNALTSTKYHDSVNFECGCGDIHRVNDPSLEIFAVSKPVKFCFICENKYVSFVQVKGFFNTKASSIWTCEAELFQKAIDDLMPDAN